MHLFLWTARNLEPRCVSLWNIAQASFQKKSSRFKSFDQYLESMMRPKPGETNSRSAQWATYIAGQLLCSATKKVSLKGSSLRHLSSHERFGDFRSIVHMLRKHFDAACSIQDSPLKEKIAIKKEKPSSWPKGLTACIRGAANWLESRNMWKTCQTYPTRAHTNRGGTLGFMPCNMPRCLPSTQVA